MARFSFAFVIGAVALIASSEAATFMQKESDIACPAPLFVADCNSAGFCVCVCKDPDNCPSTVETLSPEEAAKQAAEAHVWNEAGGPNAKEFLQLAEAKSKGFLQIAQAQKDIQCPAPLFVA